MKKIIFSGIQPTGIVHIGNYFGAIKQWINYQDEADKSIFCVVDLHAITVPQDPKALKKNIIDMASLYLAAGVNPKKSVIFVQSTRPEHSELAWVLNCYTQMGELNRMTQFKEKSEDKHDVVSAGLYDYPVLMAADILLYNATLVPVGDDQKQHVELARNIAQRFNNRHKNVFTLPQPLIKNTSSRIMGLDNPLKKMSKSAASEYNYIAISDSADKIASKIKKAVTDSGSEIVYSKDKPAITNLINIYCETSGESVEAVEDKFKGKSYGEFKSALADLLIEFLLPIQKKMDEFNKDHSEVIKILEKGSADLSETARDTMKRVKEEIGIGINV